MARREQLPWIVRLGAIWRLLIAALLALLVYVAQSAPISFSSRILLSWDVGAFVYLLRAWTTVTLADADMTRLRAQSYDQSAFIIFLLVVSAACASVIAIGFVMSAMKGLPFWQRSAHLALSVLALVFAWLLIQTLFAFHYARGSYATDPATGTPRAGLRFPSDDSPDYLDFMYYAFVVGMTPQVSDVVVTGHAMRRTTLIHGVLSFMFNVAIVAMSVNIISGAL